MSAIEKRPRTVGPRIYNLFPLRMQRATATRH